MINFLIIFHQFPPILLRLEFENIRSNLSSAKNGNINTKLVREIKGVRKDLKIIQNILPLEEIYTGSNYKSYKHKYYIAYMANDIKPEKHLVNILNFLKLKSDKKTISRIINTPLRFGKINADRAFAHKGKGIKVKVDYDRIVSLVRKRL